ncbi:MAG: hypothetical protein JXA20_12920 [Spirochaetes bacterium]|nr:hypothetical protein [Spirochaetota bacterium]
MSSPACTLCRVSLTAALLLCGAAAARADEPRDFRWFWCFYEREAGVEYAVQVYRPFYMLRSDPSGLFDASLMPVGFWRYRTAAAEEWNWLFGLGESLDRRHRDGERDYDFGFFPLLFFGLGAERERYLLVWPVGGTLRGKFGMERISAILFPGVLLFFFFPPASVTSILTPLYIVASMIPVIATYDYGDYHGWGVLWPLFHRGTSPIRDELRIFPLYSHFHKAGWYDRWSLLFLFNYEVVYFSDDEHRTLFLFPLFGRRWSNSGRVSGTTVLWPFFSWGYDRRSGNTSYNLPWPLVQIQDQETPFIRKRIFFPFYGDYRYERSRTLFVTPLYFRMTKESEIFDSQNHFICVIAWYFRREYHGEAHPYYGRSWRYLKVWPLFHAESNDCGDASFSLLSLLPFRDPEGYERLYQPFWSLVEYRRFRNGERRLGLLLRLYYQRWGDDFFQMQIPFLISLSISENRLTEFSFLLSMFGYRHSGRGRYIRLFWIPIRVGDTEIGDSHGGSAAVAEREDEDTTASSGIDPVYPPSHWGDGSVRFRHGFF